VELTVADVVLKGLDQVRLSGDGHQGVGNMFALRAQRKKKIRRGAANNRMFAPERVLRKKYLDDIGTLG
jgi:hypothetical protein